MNELIGADRIGAVRCPVGTVWNPAVTSFASPRGHNGMVTRVRADLAQGRTLLTELNQSTRMKRTGP